MNIIQHIIEPERLFLAWQAPDSLGNRRRHIVGELFINEGSVCLRYFHEDEVQNAIHLGFDRHPAFPRLDQEYCTGVLEAFMRRLPPRNRGDFGRYLDQLRLPRNTEISDFALLGYSQAKLPGDGFSLIHPFDNVDTACELMTEVAGFRHQEGISVDQLSLGEHVDLTPEPDNPVDPNAISVHTDAGRIGYINRGQLAAFNHWISETTLEASIERINGTPDRPLIYLFVKVNEKVATKAA